MFLRAKKIKGIDYAYIVENSWKNGAKQKVKGYVGRVYSFDNKNNTDFISFLNINENDFRGYIEKNEKTKIIEDLIKWEFFKHNIANSEFSIDFGSSRVVKKNKNVCIKINEGYLCGFTLTNILNFRPLPEEMEEQSGLRLARVFIEAGINIHQEVFIGLFEKIKCGK